MIHALILELILEILLVNPKLKENTSEDPFTC